MTAFVILAILFIGCRKLSVQRMKRLLNPCPSGFFSKQFLLCVPSVREVIHTFPYKWKRSHGGTLKTEKQPEKKGLSNLPTTCCPLAASCSYFSIQNKLLEDWDTKMPSGILLCPFIISQFSQRDMLTLEYMANTFFICKNTKRENKAKDYPVAVTKEQLEQGHEKTRRIQYPCKARTPLWCTMYQDMQKSEWAFCTKHSYPSLVPVATL